MVCVPTPKKWWKADQEKSIPLANIYVGIKISRKGATWINLGFCVSI